MNSHTKQKRTASIQLPLMPQCEKNHIRFVNEFTCIWLHDHQPGDLRHHLALLHLYCGKRKVGKRCMQIARQLAEQENPEQFIHYAADVAYDLFAQLISGEIWIFES